MDIVSQIIAINHDKGQKLVKCVVVRNAEWDEYIVKAYTAEGRYPAADYHTSDVEDAHDTRDAMLRDTDNGFLF